MTLQTLNLIFKKVQTHNEPPSPRHGHSAICYQDSMIIFGGLQNETNQTLNDLHILDLKNWTWTQPQTSGEIPSPRSFHTAVLYNHQMLVWGGSQEVGQGTYNCRDNDLYILNLHTWEWSKITPTGTPPTPRCQHSAILYQDKLIIDGGAYDFYFSRNDLHILNLKTMSWLPLQIENCYGAAFAGLKIQGNTLIKFLGDAAYEGFCNHVLLLEIPDFDYESLRTLKWEKANIQGIENYGYKVVLPNSQEWEEYEEYEDEEYEDEDDDIIICEDGIPVRSVHGYGEIENNLILFAGVAPGDGISHITIGDLVLLNIPDSPTTGTYTWLLPQTTGEIPPPRFAHTTIQYNQQTIIFGGLWLDTWCGNHSYDHDVYILKIV
ncbi:MAG TPA: kelch repeat-containing protein [Nostocaceae cyanobacterium]|nr:kelch repeat-containing protein [Nostocaceae cyanobacterium]